MINLSRDFVFITWVLLFSPVPCVWLLPNSFKHWPSLFLCSLSLPRFQRRLWLCKIISDRNLHKDSDLQSVTGYYIPLIWSLVLDRIWTFDLIIAFSFSLSLSREKDGFFQRSCFARYVVLCGWSLAHLELCGSLRIQPQVISGSSLAPCPWFQR